MSNVRAKHPTYSFRKIPIKRARESGGEFRQLTELVRRRQARVAIRTPSLVRLTDLTTRSYNAPMPKPRSVRHLHFPLREAKNRLSELVRLAAQGKQVTITLHGKPYAQLSRVTESPRQFKVDRKWLLRMKVVASQTPAEVLIRAERDGRP